MKSGVNKNKWLGCRMFAAMVISLLVLSVGCEKTYEMDLPLAVTSNKLTLTKDAGNTHILVYASGKWSATLTDEVKWASINKLSGEGNADIIFSYAANYGISRKVGVVFTAGDLRDTVMLAQDANITAPALNFDDREMTLLGAASTAQTSLTTNVPYNMEDVKVEITYASSESEASDAPQPDSGEESWISDIKLSAKAFSFKTSKYTGELPRVGTITLRLTDAVGNEVVTMLTVTQTNELPKLILKSTAGVYPGYSAEQLVEAETNLLSYAKQVEVTTEYEVPVAEGEEWITSARLTSEGLKFNLTASEQGARAATIKLAFTDSDGNAVEASHKVSQKIYPKLLSFTELRAKIAGASGEFIVPTENAVEGIVISDLAGANSCLSPQTAQFVFHQDESLKTAYVESTDGMYGFCVKFTTKEGNVLQRYSKVRISLKDLTLVKESDPVRYTLKGLTAENIIEASEPSVSLLPAKNKSLGQLTDDDIYTLVALQNMEITFKDGAYTNLNDGYALKCAWNLYGRAENQVRADCMPLLMSDPTGGTIYMLTNALAPWRRDGSGVPQGAGVFNGVVVAEKLVRYGDLGRYQVRAMAKSDIALGASPFSQTLVEWNWNNLTADLIPEVGTGALDLYLDAANSAEKIAASQDYNDKSANTLSGTTQMKGAINNAGLYIHRNWWNWTTDEGQYFDVKFSTTGVSGTNLMVGFTWNHGAGNDTTFDSPAHWKMLVSIDGTTFTEVVPLIINRTIVWNAGTLQDSCPGFRDHLFRLPQSCFGKETVTVRLQVADKVTDVKTAGAYPNDLGAERGTLTSKVTGIRLGALTVRYN